MNIDSIMLPERNLFFVIQAQENQYVQQQEAEKLKARKYLFYSRDSLSILREVRESISKQRQHLDEVERHISEIEKK